MRQASVDLSSPTSHTGAENEQAMGKTGGQQGPLQGAMVLRGLSSTPRLWGALKKRPPQPL